MSESAQTSRSRSPLYRAWVNMRQRTTNRRAYPTYAGVDCDPRWETFEGFVAHQPTTGRAFEPGLCLARFGDLGHYTPENTRWLTRSENSREQRRPAPVTHCKHGHEYTPANTKTDRKGVRRCRRCAIQRSREWRTSRGR